MMNKEIVKAMNKKENKMKKWWNKNSYKVARVVFFPVYLGVLGQEKVAKKIDAQEVWSEEKAHEILSYYIPRKAKWIAEENTFYFADNGMGWGMKCHQKKVKMKDRRWWRKYSSLWGGKVRKYLIDNFELEGFVKEVGDCADGWTEVRFKMIEK